MKTSVSTKVAGDGPSVMRANAKDLELQIQALDSKIETLKLQKRQLGDQLNSSVQVAQEKQ